jgi:riboflavin-specific deaminase-like protein
VSLPKASHSRKKAGHPGRLSLPFVVANFAITWDGRISTRNLTPSDFSSKKDKRRLLEIRARGDALLVGRGTLEKENMRMGLPDADLRAGRLRRKQAPYPIRVILSNFGRIERGLRVFQEVFSPILIYSTTRMPKGLQAELAKHAILHLTEGKAVNLREMLEDLRSRHKVKRLVCEGGGAVFRSLLEAGLVNEINLTLCPRIFGGKKAPSLTGVPGPFLPRSIQGRIKSMEMAGGECFLRCVLG